MAFEEIGVAYVSIIPSAKGIQGKLAAELAPISGAAALEGQRAGKALTAGVAGANVAGAFEKEGARAATSFERSTSRNLGRAFAKLGGLGTGFGVPFANELSAVGAKLDSTSIKGKNLGQALSKIGGAEVVAGAAGLALLGRSSAHAAQDFKVAQARLTQALANQGSSFGAQREEVEKTNTAMRKLGFTDTETEAALARLIGATHNVSKAQRDVALAADLARLKGIALGDATQGIALAEVGRFRILGQLGIQTKDLTGKTNASEIALKRLSEVVGGQAQAFMGTFAGKLAAVHAEADKLEVTVGEALIPKIEALASGTVGAVQGFEKANRATDGFLGKAVALGAAIPVGVFALEKLNSAGVKILGQFGKLGDAFRLTTTSAEAAAAAEGTLAAAQTAGAAGAGAKLAAAVPLATAEQAEVAAALELVTAEQALAAIQFEVANAIQVDVAALAELTAASEAAAVAQTNLAAATETATAARVGAAVGGAGAGAGTAATAAAGTSALLIEAAAVGTLAQALGNAKLDKHARDMGGLSSAALGAGRAFAGALIGPAANVISGALGFVIDRHHKNKEATDQDTVAALRDAQAKLEEAVANDKLAGNLGQLRADKQHLAQVTARLSAAEAEVNDVLGLGADAFNTNAVAVEKAQFAYLGLGDAVKTAQGVLEALTTRAFKPIKLDIAATSAKTDLADAIAALHETPDTATGGGGAKQTATAAALEQRQKELAVRDARQGVIDATQGVADAEKQLNQARQASVSAQSALTSAENNYRTVLQGVARDSQAARDATENLTKAKNDATGAQLDVRSAKRRLAQAKNDRALLAIAVQDAREQLKADQGISDVNTFVPSATGSKAVAPKKASKTQIAKDQIALNDALIAQSGADDTVKQAELDLSNARLRAKDATKAQNDAQRTYNGTLHGFPPNSREAKAAQDQLTTAQRDARTAADNVTTAYRNLGTAERQIATAALASQRATADLAGKLDSVGGSAISAGKKLNDFVTKLNNAKQKSIDAATAIAAQVPRVAQLPVLGVLSMIETLKGIIDKEPLLAASLGVAIQSLENDLLKLQSKAGSAAEFLKLLPTSSIGGSTHRAGGGPVGPGKLFVVGENGPELLVSPPRGEIVPPTSLRNSRPFAAGGGDTIYLTVNTMDAQRDAPFVVRALEAHCDKNGGLPPKIKTRN